MSEGMRSALVIEHNPIGYRLKLFVSELDGYVVLRTGEQGAIALGKDEARQVVEWLQGWLSEQDTKGV